MPHTNPTPPAPPEPIPLPAVSAQEVAEEVELRELEENIARGQRRAAILRKQRELSQIQRQIAAMEAGEPIPEATLDIPSRPRTATTALTATRTSAIEYQLPKPDPPPKYETKGGRKSLNAWVRGCEAFIQDTQALPTPRQQVQFARRYLGDIERDAWDRAVRSIPPELHETRVNWAFMKETMLKALGSPWEREQQARNRVKRATQGNRHPTELLSYLQTQWDEIDAESALNDRDPHHIHEYYSALHEKVRERLEMQPQRWSSLQDLEYAASQHWRSVKDKVTRSDGKRGADHSPPGRDDRKRGKSNQHSREGPNASRTGPNRYGNDRPRRSPRDPTQETKDRENKACFTCHKTDHFARECPEKERSGKD
jgi:hypothetical protein